MSTYKGKYPRRIHTVSGVKGDRGAVTVTCNDGTKWRILAKDNGGAVPCCGVDLSQYVYEGQYEPQRHGDWILICVPNYWAKGKTFADAVKKLDSIAFKAFRHYQVHERAVYSVHIAAKCDEIYGSIHSPIGHPPIQLTSLGKKGTIETLAKETH